MLNYFVGEWSKLPSNKENLERFLSLAPSLCLYDLGASGGVPPPFCWLGKGIELVNFEPDKRAEVDSHGRNCSVAIGPPAMRKLYINRRQTTSSLLPACESVVRRYDFCRLFPEEPRIFETVAIEEINTVGLDDAVRLFTLPCPDFLKIDVQGMTYEVLETGKNTLAGSTLGIQVEVEFLETYTGQRTFGSVHDFLHEQGFEIFRLTNLNRWPYKTAMQLRTYTGQDVFCDLLYLRSLGHLERFPEFWVPSRIIQHLRICLLYDLPDFAAAFMEKAIERRLIDADAVQDITKLIMDWSDALTFFFHCTHSVPEAAQGRRRQFLHACVLMLKALMPLSAYNALASGYRLKHKRDRVDP